MEQKEIKDMIKESVCMISGKKMEIVDGMSLFKYINALDAVYVVMEIEKKDWKNLSGKFKNSVGCYDGEWFNKIIAITTYMYIYR